MIASRTNPAASVTLILAATVAATAAAATGPAPPLVGDRPDFTESAVTITPGRVQIEAGLTRTSEGDVESTEVGEVLLRIGLLPALEARVGLGSWARIDAPAGDVDGLTDLDLGAKLALLEGAGARPTVAVIGAVSLPTGAEGVGSEEAEPVAILAAEWELTEAVGMGTNLGWSRPAGGEGRFDRAWISAALGVSLDDRWGWFLEGYGFGQEKDGGDATGHADTGVTYRVHDDLQLDARVGKSFRGEADDWFAGLGVVLRI